MPENNLTRDMEAYTSAWKRGDVDAGMAFWADNIVTHAPGNSMMSGVFLGKAAVRHQLVDRIYQETAKAEVVRVLDQSIGTDHVFAIVRQRFEKGDGSWLETDRFLVYRWLDRKIVEIRYFDRDQELTDAFWGPPR